MHRLEQHGNSISCVEPEVVPGREAGQTRVNVSLTLNSAASGNAERAMPTALTAELHDLVSY